MKTKERLSLKSARCDQIHSGALIRQLNVYRRDGQVLAVTRRVTDWQIKMQILISSVPTGLFIFCALAANAKE